MDTQKLKDKILQLAIQGKLVEQDPSDEPASQLLKKIEAEKKKLYKEGKIRKPKKLPPINEEEKPFEIPDSWEWVRLGEIISIKSGDFLPRKNMIDDGEFPVYGGNGINGYYNKYNIREKQIIIGRVGYYCGNVHLTKKKSWITDNAFITYFDDKNIYKDFLVWLLRKTNLRQKNNATAQPVISGRKIYPIKVPMPPLKEQKRIVEKIDELFKLIDRLDSDKEKLLETIELTRNKVLQDAIQGKLVEQDSIDEPASELLKKIEEEKKKLYKEGKIRKPKKLPPIKDEEKPFEIPESWEWVRLEEITNTISTRKHQIKQSQIKESGKYPVISQSQNKIEGYYNDEKSLININYPVIIFGDHTRCVKYIDFNFIVGADGVKILEPFFKNMQYLYYSILNNANAIDDRGYSRHYKYLANNLISLPPVNEQKRIVEKIDSIFHLCEVLEKYLDD